MRKVRKGQLKKKNCPMAESKGYLCMPYMFWVVYFYIFKVTGKRGQ